MPWIYASLFAPALLLAAGVADPSSYTATHPVAYAGTYAFRVCRGPCTAAPDFTGTLVLFERPIRNAQGQFFRADLDTQYANGCFVWSKTSGGPFSSEPRRFISWALFEDAADLELVHSSDGGYFVRLNLAPKGLHGTGMVGGGAIGPVAPNSTPPVRDEVIAQRLGEPDIKLCAPHAKPVVQPAEGSGL